MNTNVNVNGNVDVNNNGSVAVLEVNEDAGSLVVAEETLQEVLEKDSVLESEISESNSVEETSVAVASDDPDDLRQTEEIKELYARVDAHTEQMRTQGQIVCNYPKNRCSTCSCNGTDDCIINGVN